MSSGHKTFIEGLAGMGHSLGHPGAQAIIDRAKEVVHDIESRVEEALEPKAEVKAEAEVAETKALNEGSLAAAKAAAKP